MTSCLRGQRFDTTAALQQATIEREAHGAIVFVVSVCRLLCM